MNRPDCSHPDCWYFYNLYLKEEKEKQEKAKKQPKGKKQ
jgi:hypothetical protein